MMFNRNFLKAIALGSISCFVLNCTGKQPPKSVAANSQVERRYNRINETAGFENYQKAPASVPWGSSYLMQSYVAMFKATKDIKYLEELGDFAEGVLNLRADKDKTLDFRGETGRAQWFTNFHGGMYGWMVTSGMATYPMAEFIATVYGNADLQGKVFTNGETYLGRAKRFEQALDETIASHETEWDEAEGVYRFSKIGPGHKNLILPVNQYLAFARTLLVLGKTVGNDEYLRRARKMAERFKGVLKLNEEKQIYTWLYWPEVTGTPEDFSHGAIDIDFVILCREYGLDVFSEEDFLRFANTAVGMSKGGGTFANYVGGTGKTGVPESFAMYVGLSETKPEIYSLAEEFFTTALNMPDDAKVGRPQLIVLGLANLERYRPAH